MGVTFILYFFESHHSLVKLPTQKFFWVGLVFGLRVYFYQNPKQTYSICGTPPPQPKNNENKKTKLISTYN